MRSWFAGWPRLRCSLSRAFLICSSSELWSSALAARTSDTLDSLGRGSAITPSVSLWLRYSGTVSNTASTIAWVYWPANLLTAPTLGWLPATTSWQTWWEQLLPGHVLPSTSMDFSLTRSLVLLRMKFWLPGSRRPKRHMWHLTTWKCRNSFSISGCVHKRDPDGCSNNAWPPSSTCCLSSQQKRMNILLWALRLKTSWGSMVRLLRWNQPPSLVHGGHSTNNRGGSEANCSFTCLRTLGMVKSYTFLMSKETARKPCALTTGKKNVVVKNFCYHQWWTAGRHGLMPLIGSLNLCF